MSVESARSFIARMNSDSRFRAAVENLELEEQQLFVKKHGFVFSVDDIRYAIEHPEVNLDAVIGGAPLPGYTAFESEFARSWKEAG